MIGMGSFAHPVHPVHPDAYLFPFTVITGVPMNIPKNRSVWTARTKEHRSVD
jgi:hypothetical protein